MQTEAEIRYFLERAGWGDAVREELFADFSSRRYARLRRESGNPQTAILMMAEPDQKTGNFVHLAFLLRRLKIAAPEIYESDEGRDLVLMQDFGDQQCGKLLSAGEERTYYDYEAAAILAQLHKAFRPSMLGALKTSLFNAALFTDQATLFLDHYFPHVFHRAPTAMERSGFVEAWHTALAPLDALPRTLILRDFMPDNMMKLSTPELGQKMGLLDFQDAGLGPVTYDLGAWCEEVRRDGGLDRLETVISTYHTLNPVIERAALMESARIYLAQRHTRILGILVKLKRTEHLPRVRNALKILMKDEKLSPVRRWFSSCAPPS